MYARGDALEEEEEAGAAAPASTPPMSARLVPSFSLDRRRRSKKLLESKLLRVVSLVCNACCRQKGR